jgi:hypothetical protein
MTVPPETVPPETVRPITVRPNPSSVFGEIRQNGYVVPDVSAAVNHWVTVLGVAPWIIFEHVPVQHFQCDGIGHEMDMTIALAHVGNLQIELIEQHNDTPSLYREFLAQCPLGGLQHMGFWPANMDEAIAEAERQGLVLGHGGQVGDTGRFRYYRTEAMLGTVLELAEVTGDRLTWFADWAERSRLWDGTGDPIKRRTFT